MVKKWYRTANQDRWAEYDIVERLQEMRKELGKSMYRLGKELECSTPCVMYWEEGRSFPRTLSFLDDWARRLGGRLKLSIVDRKGKEHVIFGGKR